MRSFRNLKTLSRILILALVHLCWLTSNGWAEMVPTDSAIQTESPSSIQADRQRLLDFMNREVVRKELKKYGITQQEAKERVNSLTDEEIIKIAGKLDQLSAGGHNIVEEALTDSLAQIFYEIFIWIGLIGFYSVTYFVGVLVKSVACPFREDCGTDYVLRPWWGSGDGPVYANNVPVAIQPAPAPVVEVVPTTDQNGACDPRAGSCEWSAR